MKAMQTERLDNEHLRALITSQIGLRDALKTLATRAPVMNSRRLESVYWDLLSLLTLNADLWALMIGEVIVKEMNRQDDQRD
ncbi:hypothetical protein ABDX87_28090 [Pseudomonas abietaniphila]|uniref:hypothetical protein n=1 Tax=Pseudomonas abietaniphila TaxID=89065 RepID=UPI00321716E2